MIRAGLALDTNGQWREEQLSDALQVIIAKHRRHFEGTPVGDDNVEAETVETLSVRPPSENTGEERL